MSNKRRLIAGLLLALTLATGTAAADPARLGNSPSPVVTVKGKSMQDVMNAIIGMSLPAGMTPVRQEPNSVVFEYVLGMWQSVAVQMAQGNSGWQQPKGRQTFTMAQMGPDVMVNAKVETVATNMFNASNAVVLTSSTVYNEQHLLLQLIAALAESRFVQGDHNMLGIVKYRKPTRKTKTVGVVIDSLVPGGPADRAGLKPGDMITAIGGMPTAEQSDMALSFMGWLQEGTAKLTVQGKGDVLVVKNPRPGAPPAETMASPQPIVPPPSTPATEVFASPQPINPPPAPMRDR